MVTRKRVGGNSGEGHGREASLSGPFMHLWLLSHINNLHIKTSNYIKKDEQNQTLKSNVNRNK